MFTKKNVAVAQLQQLSPEKQTDTKNKNSVFFAGIYNLRPAATQDCLFSLFKNTMFQNPKKNHSRGTVDIVFQVANARVTSGPKLV